MHHSMTMTNALYRSIQSSVMPDDPNEHAGFAFARTSTTASEVRLLLREFRPIEQRHIIRTGPRSMKIDSGALAQALKHADDTDQCVVFVHSHPPDHGEFSAADDTEEPRLFASAYTRIANQCPHASLLFPRDTNPVARIWLRNGKTLDVTRIRVVGKRFLFFDTSSEYESPEFFDRQVRAFGENTQAILSSLHIAVVGSGGTGSATIEQLIRLGVGKLSIYDGQVLEKSNVSRVFGSRSSDSGRPKVDVLAAWGREIGLGTEIVPYSENITAEAAAKTLRDADIIFGCTDDEWGRSVLNDLAIRYLIPVIDMAVKITSESGEIHSVCGRVTVLVHGAACLFCRGRISPEQIRAETDNARNPAEAAALRKEGYAPELAERDPSVIPFTSAVAALATTELLHRLTGFMGADRESTEILQLFDRSEIHTNAQAASMDCKCTKGSVVGTGDTRDFLGMLWGASE